jgi:hypothetical protein
MAEGPARSPYAGAKKPFSLQYSGMQREAMGERL